MSTYTNIMMIIVRLSLTTGQRILTKGVSPSCHLVTPRGGQWILPTWTPHLTHGSLDPYKSTPKRLTVFAYTAATSQCFSMGWTTPKLPLSLKDMDPSITRFLEPTSAPKRHLDRFSRFAGLTLVTNRQTDRQTQRQTMLFRLQQ